MKGTITTRFSSRHPAIDIAGSCGTAVRAATSGRVLFSGWKDNRGGYQVWIDGKLDTGYYHLSKVAVRRGATVKAGQVIGYRGMSGHATGCHLHFEVWRGTIWSSGYRVNPLAYY